MSTVIDVTLQGILNNKNMTKYQLSQISGVPKTTVIDICSGKSSIEKCSAKTVLRLAKALGCSMESLLEADEYDEKTGLPADRAYLECGLPSFLQSAIDAMQACWERVDRGETDIRWDCCYCELQSDINTCEVNGVISGEQAWYLREKYLRMERPGEIL